MRTGPGADSLRERVATALGLPAEEIGDQDSLTALGLDSIMRVELVRWLHDRHGITVPTSELYEHDTLAGLRAYLDTAPPAPEPVTVVAAEAEPEPAQKPEPDLAAIVRTAVERAVDADLGPDGRFTDGALSLLDMLRSVRALETVLGTLPKTLLFDHPDCAALADHLVERFGTPAVARLAGTAPVPSTGSAPGPAAGPGASPSATTPTGPTALVVPRSGIGRPPRAVAPGGRGGAAARHGGGTRRSEHRAIAVLPCPPVTVIWRSAGAGTRCWCGGTPERRSGSPTRPVNCWRTATAPGSG
ncbi:hypothetical protein SHIRM173S_09360 [Streptomyces hirsutus]